MARLNSLPPLGNPISKKGILAALSKGVVPVVKKVPSDGTANTTAINDLIDGLHTLGLFALWSPAQLFTDGSRGGWYDPSDLSTMFQDSAGTTPVTADGDPVGLLQDKSGNGNHLFQDVSGARPIYHTDGTLSWLQLDGASQFLKVVATIPSDAGEFSTGMAVRFDNVTGIQIVLDGHTSSPGAIAQFMRSNAGAAETIGFDTTFAAYTDGAGALTAATDYVLSQTRSATSIEAFINGVGDGATAASGTPATGSTTIKVGGSSAGGSPSSTSFFHAGRNYGTVLSGKALSADDRAALEQWLAAKAGVPL